jgi:hypothetical protein
MGERGLSPTTNLRFRFEALISRRTLSQCATGVYRRPSPVGGHEAGRYVGVGRATSREENASM